MEEEEERELSDDFRPVRAKDLGAIELDAEDLEFDEEDELDAGLIEDAADEDDEDVGEQRSERELRSPDERSRGHRQPAGMPPPAKDVARRRRAGMSARGAGRSRAAKGKKRAKS